MSMNSCRRTQSVHYLDSWNRHCGGEPWEFVSRSLTIADSVVLAYAGIQVSRVSRLFGRGFGASLVSKSANDIYEAWTGEDGLARQAVGDPVYDMAGYALLGYGLFRQVPKIGYLGNPKRDFFVKDPITYERAFRQYTNLGLLYEGANLLVNGHDHYEKYRSKISINLAWHKHLRLLHENCN